MKSIRLAIYSTCPFLLLALTACADTDSEKFTPSVVLERIDGSVLIGVSDTPDGRFHIWTYDIASDEFGVLASGDGGFPNLVPGITATRIAWNVDIRNDEGKTSGFRTLMVDMKRKEPVALDILRRPIGDDETNVSTSARGLFDDGRYMLVYEMLGNITPRYRVWDLKTESHSESIPIEDWNFPAVVGPASGIGKGHGVVIEMSGPDGDGAPFFLVLMDFVSMRKIGSLPVWGLSLRSVSDTPELESIFVYVLSACCDDLGYLRLTADDWKGDNTLNLEDANWFPDGVHSVSWAGDLRFWVTNDGEGEPFVLHMAPETEPEPKEATVKLGSKPGPDVWLHYIVSDDASFIATKIQGSDTFEIRSIALPEVTLLKRFRVEAREKEDGSFELSLVEELGDDG